MKNFILKTAIILATTTLYSSQWTTITVSKNIKKRLSILTGSFSGRFFGDLLEKDIYSIIEKKSEQERFYDIAMYIKKIKNDLELQDITSLKIIYSITKIDAERQALCNYLKIRHP